MHTVIQRLTPPNLKYLFYIVQKYSYDTQIIQHLTRTSGLPLIWSALDTTPKANFEIDLIKFVFMNHSFPRLLPDSLIFV